MRMLSQVLGEAVGRSEVLRAVRAQALFKRWDEIVGPHLANCSTPDRFENGILYVATTGSAWAQELTLQRQVILDRMNLMAGEELVTEIRTSRAIRKGVKNA